MSPRLAVIAVFLVLLTCLGAALLWGRQEAQAAAQWQTLAKAQEDRAMALAGRLRASQQALAVTQRRASLAETRIREVLSAHQEWRDAPVPAPIRDRLCEYVSCAPVRATEVRRPGG